MQLQISYHNTNKLTGTPLADAETHCRNQEEKILYLFRVYNQRMTPSEVFKKWQLVWPVIPLTSVRRALTNLTRREELRMVEDKLVKGIYGALEHYWELNK